MNFIWPNSAGGEVQVINHTGGDLPITLGVGWSGAYVNERDGNVVTTGTLVILPYLSRAIIQVKTGAFVNVAVVGGYAGPQYDDWTASTRVKRYEVRRATAAQGDIKIGDLIRSDSTRTTRASFDATEAGNWSEISTDPVVSVAGKTGAVTLVKADVGLSNADNTSDVNKPVSTAQQTALDGKQDDLVSGANIKTVNGSSIVGSGNVQVAADLPGGTAAAATDEGLVSGNAVVDRSTVAGQTILRYETAGAITFTVPVGVTEAWLVVAAGGGGGGDNHGGGGGAGEFFEDTTYTLTPGATIAGTIGAGGAGGAAGLPANNGANGVDTVFGTLTVNGGGGGASRDAATSLIPTPKMAAEYHRIR